MTMPFRQATSNRKQGTVRKNLPEYWVPSLQIDEINTFIFFIDLAQEKMVFVQIP
jgi:hypothetical protein